MKTCSGFTIVEAMVTIAILAIMTSIALPSFTALIDSHRLATSANEALASMMLARSEAFRSGRRVVVCKSSDSSSCSTSASWSDGWIVFVDDNANGARDSGEAILRAGEVSGGLTVTGESGAENTVVFSSRGATTIASGSPKIIFGISGRPQRELIISPTGRVSIVKGGIYP